MTDSRPTDAALEDLTKNTVNDSTAAQQNSSLPVTEAASVASIPSVPQENGTFLLNDPPFESPSEGKKATKFQAPLLSTIYDGKPFADLVRSWETYLGDSAADQFQPLLNFCGAGHGLARLTGNALPSSAGTDPKTKLSEPIALRHIHSTPLVHIPSILDDEDEDEPPPIGLEILSRSRSTPLSTSANSAFGTIRRPNVSYASGPGDRSAFSLPPYRLKPTLSSEHVPPHTTTFNPIKCEMEMTEHTSIEVTNVVPLVVPEEVPVEKPKAAVSTATSRAARFLPDFRKLRRKRRGRDGRENPARPASTSDEAGKKLDHCDDEVVTTKIHVEQEGGAPLLSGTKAIESKISGVVSVSGLDESINVAVYHHVDSDQEAGGGVAARSDSCTTVPSPIFHAVGNDNGRMEHVRIQVSNTTKGSVLPMSDRPNCTIASPVASPFTNDYATLTPQSHDSPETSRCSGTSYASGHTTQATFTTLGSGQASCLTAISETDLEIMEANKAGKLLDGQSECEQTADSGGTRGEVKGQPRYPGFIELSNGSASLREGANVPADRFFTLAGSPNDKLGLGGRHRTSSSMRKGPASHSPTTISSSSMTTNSSASSAPDEPPKFVSYLDRKTTSDLTSLRESDERSSPRAGHEREERESSPASDMLGYTDAIFEEAQAPQDNQWVKAKPRPIWPAKGFPIGRKVRSLPPRNPLKSRTPTTPPPRGGGASPAYDAVSPPRTIVDHRIDPNVSRPCVFRTTPTPTRPLPSQKISAQVLSSSGNVDYAHIQGTGPNQSAYEVVRMGTNNNLSRNYYVGIPRGPSPSALRVVTYDDQSIEIFKSDSKEESSLARTTSDSEQVTSTEC